MNKLMTLSRLACLTTALAAGSMLMTMDIANARQNHQHVAGHIQQRQVHPANYAKRYGFSPRFVISGQPANVKRVLSHHQESLPFASTGGNASGSALRATVPKGNPTQTTSHSYPSPTTAHAGDKRVGKALSAVATAGIVPAAAGVGTAILGHPGMGIVGTIQHGNPITGPA